MGEVNNIKNNPAGNPQSISRTQSRKADSAPDAAFSASDASLKELDLVNDPKFSIKQDNLNTDVKYLEEYPASVDRALEFANLAEQNHNPGESAALMGAYVKEFEP
jgi:hypothetical protein